MPRRNKTRQFMLADRRKAAIMADFLNGACSSQTDLSVRHGVSQQQVSTIIRKALEEQKRFHGEWIEHQFLLMEKRLLNEYAQSEHSYQLSRQPATETRTQYVKSKCISCKGTGWEEGDEDTEEWCEVCGGSGKVIEEQTTVTVKGQAGDSSFLANKLAIVKEWNKMHGNYPSKADLEQHVHFHQGATIDLSNLPNDSLVDAMEVIDRLKEASQKRITKVDDVIDVGGEE